MLDTLQEAEALAARVLAAIDGYDHPLHSAGAVLDAHREQVMSDVAGLRDHAPSADEAGHWPPICVYDWGDGDGWITKWPCPDARRYLAGLERTAALYGVPE